MRKYLEKILSHDYDIETSENGLLAFESLKKATTLPDIIIADIDMPVMNGIQFKEEKSKDASLREIPIVFLTAHQHHIYMMNPDHKVIFLLKPISKEDILQILSAEFYRLDKNPK